MARTFDINECAEFLKIERTHALKLAGEGTLPGAKVGKSWVFLEDDLIEYLRALVQNQMRERQSAVDVDDRLGRMSPPRDMSGSGRGRKAREKPVLPDLPATALSPQPVR